MYKLLKDIDTPWSNVKRGEVGDVLTCAKWFGLTYTEFFIRLDRGDFKTWLEKI